MSLVPDNRPFTITPYHQLHCLDAIRVSFVLNGSDAAAHVEHLSTVLEAGYLVQCRRNVGARILGEDRRRRVAHFQWGRSGPHLQRLECRQKVCGRAPDCAVLAVERIQRKQPRWPNSEVTSNNGSQDHLTLRSLVSASTSKIFLSATHFDPSQDDYIYLGDGTMKMARNLCQRHSGSCAVSRPVSICPRILVNTNCDQRDSDFGHHRFPILHTILSQQITGIS